MTIWCHNVVFVEGSAEDVKRYQQTLLRDSNGNYYPWMSSVPLPEFKGEAEVEEYISKEYGNKTLFCFGYKVVGLKIGETSPEEIKLYFATSYSPARILCIDDIFFKVNILHRYVEPEKGHYQGFAHYVKGKRIASGHETVERRDSPWEMYNYEPFPRYEPISGEAEDYFYDSNGSVYSMEELKRKFLGSRYPLSAIADTVD